MSATAHLVARNFRWRLERMSPTASSRNRFKWQDRIDPDQSPGTIRAFNVTWLGSESAHEVEDKTGQCKAHKFQLDVAYPRDTLDPEPLQNMMLQDRFDAIKDLRDSAYWTGHADDSSADLGLYDREFERDERLDVSPYTTLWRSVWRCLIWEDE